jgi:hypothetical protein
MKYLKLSFPDRSINNKKRIIMRENLEKQFNPEGIILL